MARRRQPTSLRRPRDGLNTVSSSRSALRALRVDPEPRRLQWSLWSAPGCVESGGWSLGHRDLLLGFELYRCEHAEPAVPDLEVLEDRVGELEPGPPALPVEQLDHRGAQPVPRLRQRYAPSYPTRCGCSTPFHVVRLRFRRLTRCAAAREGRSLDEELARKIIETSGQLLTGRVLVDVIDEAMTLADLDSAHDGDRG